MNDPQKGKADVPSGLVDPSGAPVRSDAPENAKHAPEDEPQEAEVEVASSQGSVYVRLPSGAALELTPETAKGLGGSLLNQAREAKKQRKALRRDS